MDIQAAIAQLVAGQSLSRADMESVMLTVMQGEATEAQIAGLLIGLRMKGETIDEIVGAASVMRSLATPVSIDSDRLIDLAGTGGSGANLFNVSTAATFVVAAAGGRVAKHGNRSSGASGSSDVLSALGVDLSVSPNVIADCIDSIGVGFMFARPETTSHLIPTATGWFAADNIFAMAIHSYDPAKDARRFESGTPAIPSLYPAAAGMEYVLKIGLENIAAYVAPLHDELREGISGLGYRVVTPKSPQNHAAMLAIATSDENAHVAALEQEKVIVSSRDGNVRISPHFYNDREDVAKVIAAFAKTKQFIRK